MAKFFRKVLTKTTADQDIKIYPKIKVNTYKSNNFQN